jgi:hypothetical protein
LTATLSNKYGVLHHPLGNWTKSVKHSRHWPQTVYNSTTDELFRHHQGPIYFKHERLRPGTFSIRPTDRQTEAEGYPTSTVIIMDTLRPVHDYTERSPTLDHTIDLRIVPPINVDTWEYELLRYCRNISEGSVIKTSIQTGQFLSCSDGSATESGGSFGFVVCTLTGQRLVKARGAAPGSIHNSFRSEAYGVLATMRWIHHMIKWSLPNPDCTITHYLDNRSVISRIEATLTHSGKFPNHRLLADQDVIDEIAATITLLPVKMALKWVKGHQDFNTPRQNLPLPAQLNCEADQEAAAYLPSATEHVSTNVPPLPKTPCQLIVGRHHITSHIQRRIHEAHSDLYLPTYLTHKFKWDATTYECIDWPSYQHIISNYKDSWTTLVKHLFDISPTGSIAHRNNSYLPHECPACLQPHEDNHHLLTCRHPSRSAWRTSTITKIYQHEASQIDPYLLDILRDGLTRLHLQLSPLAPTLYPERYATLIHHQNNIGWIHLYRARWSLEWARLQDDYNSRSRHDRQRISGASWVLSAGRMLINQWLQLWKLRNNERHGRDSMMHITAREQAATSELEELYSYRARVCPTDRSLFHTSALEHRQRHPKLEQIEDWIVNNRPAILASAEQAQRLGILRNRTLEDYPMFNPIAQAHEQASLAAGPPTD